MTSGYLAYLARAENYEQVGAGPTSIGVARWEYGFAEGRLTVHSRMFWMNGAVPSRFC